MSLLTPLYAAALAAISLPVIFHLVRRMPRSREEFSTLMFLSPSPPRLTRRSRLDQLLLLALRAAALALVALAFARPFFRAAAERDLDLAGGRRIVVLLDTSASMRRAGAWEQAVAETRRVIDDLGRGDDAALYAFDGDARPVVRLDDEVPAEVALKQARLREALAGMEPTWGATELGRALVAAAEMLDETGRTERTAGGPERVIVLVSDLQEGSRLEALEGYPWPEDVRLAVRRVGPAVSGNAAVHLAADASPAATRDRRLRVRVGADRDSTGGQLELQWHDDPAGPTDAEPVSVYVPPGESRTLRLDLADEAAARRLVLAGDDHPFDNTLHLVRAEQEEVPVVYLGSDGPDDPQGLRYFLERALPETARRKVVLLAGPPEEALDAIWGPWRAARSENGGLPFPPLVVAGEKVPEAQAARLKEYAQAGGTLLYVLREADAAGSLAAVLGVEEVPVDEADGDDYVMLSEIALDHPLFAPFADPRFSDFTKIHFWHHRRVQLDESLGFEVLSRFDDQSPAVMERTLGSGRLVVFAAGWHPADSELARSSKFVPLVSELLNLAGGREAPVPQYEVGQAVAVAAPAPVRPVVRKPDGTDVQLAPGAGQFDGTDQPGVYRVTAGPWEHLLAVNLAPSESRTAPLDTDELRQRGVRLGRHRSRVELVRHRRQMREAELESEQKLWRWLIAAALGVLVVETGVAGYLAGSPTNQPWERSP